MLPRILLPLIVTSSGLLCSMNSYAKTKTSAKASAAPLSGGMNVKEFCASFELAELQTRLAHCAESDNKIPAVASMREKAERARAQCVELLNSGLSQKRFRFHPEVARRCSDAKTTWVHDPARSAGLAKALRAACDGVIEGLVDSGKACETALDCRGGKACYGKHGGPPGKCTARRVLGEACDDELFGTSAIYATLATVRPVCGAGLSCGLTTESNKVAASAANPGSGELACVKEHQIGDSCVSSLDGADSASTCGVGLRCTAAVCVPETLAGHGERCETAADCTSGFYCLKHDQAAGYCTLRKNAGTTCGAADECKGSCTSGICAALCGSG